MRLGRRSFWLGAGLVAATAIFLRWRRRLWARLLDLRPPGYAVRHHKNLRLAMPDGVTLATDHYEPYGRRPLPPLPAILVRTPYGRANLLTRFYGLRFAERGYHVLIQDTRGQFDSGGEFDLFAHEDVDGKATLDWIAAQAWCNGRIGMWGISYLGYCQWAAASLDDGQQLGALFPMFCASQMRTVAHPDGVLALDLAVRLSDVLDGLSRRQWPWQRLGLLDGRQQAAKLAPIFAHVPLATAETKLPRPYKPQYRWRLDRIDPQIPYWQETDHSAAAAQTEAPVHLVGGWYDIFLRETLADYQRLRAAGRQPHLTVGPWPHVDLAWVGVGLGRGLDWFDAHLKDRPVPPGQPVQVFVVGADTWRSFDEWPPPATATPFYLQPHGWLLRRGAEAVAEPSRYRYDPADPTPSVGGNLLMPIAGPVDNRALEARPDVLTFTTPLLPRGLTVIGPVRLVLYVRSSLGHTDFSGRLCDVQRDGRSLNVCDGLFRLRPGEGERQADGTVRLEVDMWATAHHFAAGHRIRLQVASGMHPRYNRNLGTGEPDLTAERMNVAEQEIYHDETHPSTLLLPLTPD